MIKIKNTKEIDIKKLNKIDDICIQNKEYFILFMLIGVPLFLVFCIIPIAHVTSISQFLIWSLLISGAIFITGLTVCNSVRKFTQKVFNERFASIFKYKKDINNKKSKFEELDELLSEYLQASFFYKKQKEIEVLKYINIRDLDEEKAIILKELLGELYDDLNFIYDYFTDMVDFFIEKNLSLEKVEEIAKNINTITQKELDKCDISNIDDTLLYLYKNDKENYDKVKENKNKAIEMINDIITFQVNNSIEMKDIKEEIINDKKRE